VTLAAGKVMVRGVKRHRAGAAHRTDEIDAKSAKVRGSPENAGAVESYATHAKVHYVMLRGDASLAELAHVNLRRLLNEQLLYRKCPKIFFNISAATFAFP
jgi:hypothetical protein